jgi:thiamine pyrophosphate-dependent enzyme
MTTSEIEPGRYRTDQLRDSGRAENPAAVNRRPEPATSKGEPPMSQTVAEFVLERLHQHGIARIFGYPGDGINGLLGAFHTHGKVQEFVNR